MRRAVLAATIVTALAASMVAPAAALADRPLAASSAAAADQLDVIVALTDQPDLAGVAAEGHRARRRAVLRRLRDTADLTQRPLRQLLAQRRREGLVSRVEPLWVVNALRVTAAPSVVIELGQRADVRSVTPNLVLAGPDGAGAPDATAAATANQALVNADDLWALGYRGSGVVVAGLDTGVSETHPDLAAQYRGGTNSWFDPYRQHATPFDPHGHGTMTMGVMVGRDASGTSLGTAPDARWMAAKVFDDRGQATISAIHQGFQWLLDPDGNPATNDAPSVVNNSWALGTPGCNVAFQPDLQALRASAIVPVFSAGNYGPDYATATSPANYPEAFAVGAIDNDDLTWSSSSRGPTSCGDSTGVYPDVVAPGVDVPTVDLFDTYTTSTGTSVAAPHATGAIALLLDAFPGATPVELESALTATAHDLGPPGPDDVYGNGSIDVLAAYQALVGSSIGDLVFDDRDADGARDEGEPGLADVGVRLLVPGTDGQLGTSDDVLMAERTTDGFGAYVFDRLAAGSYRVEVDPATVPPGASLTTGNTPLDVTLGSRQDVRDADFGYRIPGPPWVLSFEQPVTLDGGSYGPEDVVAFDGTAFTLLIDGSDIGLSGRNLDAMHLIDADTLVISLATSATLNGIGTVTDADLLRFDATSLGATSSGTLSLWFDGSDVGLTTSAEDVDAVSVLADGRLVVSTLGAAQVPAATTADEDLLVFAPVTLGATTTGSWAMWFDGSDVGLSATSENVDGIDTTSGELIHLTTTGAFSVPDGSAVVTGGDESAFSCTLALPGPSTQCSWLAPLTFDGPAAGLPASVDVDAIAAR